MKRIIFLLLIFNVLIASAQKRTIVFPNGNTQDIQMVKADAQGKYIYTADASKCAMWEAKTGRQLYSFLYDGSRDVTGMDISPDGKLIAIARDGGFQIFNTETSKEIKFNLPIDKNDFDGFSIRDVVFTDNDNLLFAIYGGIAGMNLITLSFKKFVKTPTTFNIKSHIYLLPDNKLLLASLVETTIYDRNSWQQISTAHYEDNIIPVILIANIDKINFLPTQRLIVGTRSFGDADAVRFFDINTGKLINKIKVNSSDPVIIPSVNTDEFLMESPLSKPGDHKLVLYSSTNFQQKPGKINNNNDPAFYTQNGYFNGQKQKALFTYNTQVDLYDLAQNKTTNTLHGITIGAGFFDGSFFKYHEPTGLLNIRNDDHYIKEIDLEKMKTVRHTDLQERPIEITVSTTGDTVALFEFLTVTIKNIKTNKIIRAKTSLNCKNAADASISFFSKDGQFLFYGKDNAALFKMNITTGIQQKVFSVNGFRGIHTDENKTIMYGMDMEYDNYVASVWDLATGKKIFQKRLYNYDDDLDRMTAIVSADKKRVLVQDKRAYWLYDLATKKAIIDSMPLFTPTGLGAANASLTIFSDGFTLRDINGKEIQQIGKSNESRGSAMFSADNKLLYSFKDAGVQVYEIATGRFIGTLYLFKETNDYVFMDADGRFDGTPDGMKSLYYVLKRKPISLDALYEKYYTPNLYARLVANEKFAAVDIADVHDLPIIKMTYAAAQRNLEVDDDMPVYTNTTGAAEITVTATAPDDAVDEIRLFQNGKIVTLTTRNLIVTDAASGTDTKKYTLALMPGQNNIRSIALNSQRTESDADEIIVNYKTANNAASVITQPVINNTKPVDAIDKNATLHLIVVGINQYQNKTMSLNYALADATSFKEELEKDVKSVIGNVKTYFVTDNAASKKGITDAFKEVQQNAKPQDVFIFYYAGHGVIGKDKEFYLVPEDVSDLSNVQTELEQKGIPSKLLQQYAIDIQAQKQLFILDACQSAGAFETLMSNDGNQQKSLAVVARSTGTHWMAASGAQQFANEFSALGHGAFTYVLLQALKGEAASNKMVTVNGLKNFLQLQVPALMKKYNGAEQYPTSYGFGNDFPVEIINK